MARQEDVKSPAFQGRRSYNMLAIDGHWKAIVQRIHYRCSYYLAKPKLVDATVADRSAIDAFRSRSGCGKSLEFRL